MENNHAYILMFCICMSMVGFMGFFFLKAVQEIRISLVTYEERNKRLFDDYHKDLRLILCDK